MVRFDYGVVLIENLKKADLTLSGFLDAKAIARAHKLSPSLMGKVAQELKQTGWLESKRGSGGGYKLIKNEVSVADVINFFEKPRKICPITRKLGVRN